MKKKLLQQLQWLMLLAPVFATGCKDDGGTDTTTPVAVHDPNKPVVISGFTPEEASAYSDLVIAGDNFGSDVDLITVMVGGIDATVISSDGQNIYAFVPAKAFTGTIEVLIGKKPGAGETDTRIRAKADKTLAYKSDWVVRTIAGYRNTNDSQGWVEGPFQPDENGRRYSGFMRDGVLAIDPANRNHIYSGIDDGFGYIQLIDLEREYISNAMNVNRFPVGGSQRLRSIDFSLELPAYGKPAGQYMIVSFDVNSGDETESVFIVERNANGTFDDSCPITTLASYKQCNGASVHPINGEIYFNSFGNGDMFRVDLNDWLADPNGWEPAALKNPKIEHLFTIADPGWEFKITIHPTGAYAYLNILNQNYIMRTDYNFETKTFSPPYTVAGHYRVGGYRQDVGTQAYINRPYQGAFAKNEEYAGKSDEYDFYFSENNNRCVSRLTPEGLVETFAGRGSSSMGADGNDWGTEDGSLRVTARFRDPAGLVYDEPTKTFYVTDREGRTLRTISKDMPEETQTDSNN